MCSAFGRQLGSFSLKRVCSLGVPGSTRFTFRSLGAALATARVEATQRYALGVALTRDFGRFRGIGTVIQPSAGR